MHLSFGLFGKLVTDFFDVLVHLGTDFDNGVNPVFVLLFVDFQVESHALVLGNFYQCIYGPRVEPVDRRAVHDCREVSDACPEFFADGVHGHYNVQPLADAWDEVLPLVAGDVLLVGVFAHQLDYLVALVGRVGLEEVGHLAGVEQVVDALDLRLELDVRIVEHERSFS